MHSCQPAINQQKKILYVLGRYFQYRVEIYLLDLLSAAPLRSFVCKCLLADKILDILEGSGPKNLTGSFKSLPGGFSQDGLRNFH